MAVIWLNQHLGDFWVHQVDELGGAKTVPGVSFWGFASNDSTEDFSNPVARQDDLDPVNVIFFAGDSSSALTHAYRVLTSTGWTTVNPCEEEFGIPATPLFAYFEGAPVGEEQDLHLFKPVDGCNEKFHIRLFQPVTFSPWVIGAVHHECSTGLPGDARCILFDTVIGWEDAEDLVKADLTASGRLVDNWMTDLANTDFCSSSPSR